MSSDETNQPTTHSTIETSAPATSTNAAEQIVTNAADNDRTQPVPASPTGSSHYYITLIDDDPSKNIPSDYLTVSY